MPAKPKIKKAVPNSEDKAKLFDDPEFAGSPEDVKDSGDAETKVAGRGKKTCPSCGKVVGARSRICDCGFEFPIGEKIGRSPRSPKLDIVETPKKTSSEKMLGLLSGQGINAELTMRFENGEIVTALKIDGKGSKLKWIGEDPGLIGNGEVLLHISDSPNGSQARVSLPLGDFIKML